MPILLTGCGFHKQPFIEIQYCTDACGLMANSLYPQCDLSEIKSLPVYTYIDDKNSLYERTAEFTDKLHVDISEMTDKT